MKLIVSQRMIKSMGGLYENRKEYFDCIDSEFSFFRI